MTLSAKSCTETTMSVLIAGNTTNGATLYKDGSVSKLSIIRLFRHSLGELYISLVLHCLP
jgi:hypothetical protein